jgi:hypothetical protein
MRRSTGDDRQMTQQEALYRSLAACGAFHIAFVGLVHEVMGPTLFPFLPAVFGFFVWHATGFAFIMVGLLLLGGHPVVARSHRSLLRIHYGWSAIAGRDITRYPFSGSASGDHDQHLRWRADHLDFTELPDVPFLCIQRSDCGDLRCHISSQGRTIT